MSEKKSKVSSVARATIKTVAGMSLLKKEDLVKLAANAGDNILKKDFSKALAETYIYLLNKGSINKEYLDSTELADLAPEFGQVVNGNFSRYKLNQLRKAFANLAKDNGRTSNIKYLLQIALDMSEQEIKVLLADYSLAAAEMSEDDVATLRQTNTWMQRIAEISGLQLVELVNAAEGKLMERQLFSGRVYSDGSALHFNKPNGRLTPLGAKLCHLLTLDDDPLVES